MQTPSEITANTVACNLHKVWSDRRDLLDKLQARIGYRFEHDVLLMEALTHSSAARDFNRTAKTPLVWNERLEFLGDSVLGLVISTNIMGEQTSMDEGELSKLRAAVVQEQTLAHRARQLNLGAALLLSRGEELGGGAQKDSILADALEAVIGAVYLDGGFSVAEGVVKRLMAEELAKDWHQVLVVDYKTQLQELVQDKCRLTPVYVTQGESGPAHAPVFSVKVMIGDKEVAVGHGSSKKRASQDAAMHALTVLVEQEDQFEVR